MDGRKKVLCVLALCGLVAAGLSVAQEETEVTLQDAQKAIAQVGTPGPHHQHLASLAGIWQTEMTMWLSPTQPPLRSNGTAEGRWILDGRFLQTTLRSDFGGRSFEGQLISGYDNGNKHYVGSWVHNLSTGLVSSTGTCSDRGQVHTNEGRIRDPGTGKNLTMRTITTSIDPNHFRVDMWVITDDGKEFQTLQVIATRAGT